MTNWLDPTSPKTPFSISHRFSVGGATVTGASVLVGLPVGGKVGATVTGASVGGSVRVGFSAGGKVGA